MSETMIVILGVVLWLGLGIAGVVANLWLADEGEKIYQGDHGNSRSQSIMTFATLLGLFGLLGAFLEMTSKATLRRRREKTRLADEMARDLREARKELDTFLAQAKK